MFSCSCVFVCVFIVYEVYEVYGVWCMLKMCIFNEIKFLCIVYCVLCIVYCVDKKFLKFFCLNVVILIVYLNCD